MRAERHTRRNDRRAAAFIAVAALACAAAANDGHALALADITVQSSLGEPLRAIIPVVGRAEDEMADCLTVAPSITERADGIPDIARAQVALRRGPDADFLVVTTTGSMNEPAARLTVQAGCAGRFSREYVVLLDPPIAVAAPTVAIAPLAGAEPIEPTAGAGAPGEPPKRESSSAPASTAPTSAGRRSSTTDARASTDGKSSAARTASARRKPATAPPALVISRAVPASGSAGANPLAPKFSEQEILNAIDEDTEALRQRVADLKKTIERMNEQLLLEEARSKAAEQTQVASIAAPAAAQRDWRDDWIAMAAAVVALVIGVTVGALWAGRRSRPGRHLGHDAPILDSGLHRLSATRANADATAAGRGLAVEPSLAHSDLEAHFDEDVIGGRATAKPSLSR